MICDAQTGIGADRMIAPLLPLASAPMDKSQPPVPMGDQSAGAFGRIFDATLLNLPDTDEPVVEDPALDAEASPKDLPEAAVHTDGNRDLPGAEKGRDAPLHPDAGRSNGPDEVTVTPTPEPTGPQPEHAEKNKPLVATQVALAAAPSPDVTMPRQISVRTTPTAPASPPIAVQNPAALSAAAVNGSTRQAPGSGIIPLARTDEAMKATQPVAMDTDGAATPALTRGALEAVETSSTPRLNDDRMRNVRSEMATSTQVAQSERSALMPVAHGKTHAAPILSERLVPRHDASDLADPPRDVQKAQPAAQNAMPSGQPHAPATMPDLKPASFGISNAPGDTLPLHLQNAVEDIQFTTRSVDSASQSNTTATLQSPNAKPVVMQVLHFAPQPGQQAVDITLSPEELGKVRLSMVTIEGTLTLAITAERSDTLDLLRRHAAELGQEFVALGYSDIEFQFTEGGRDMQQDSPEPADADSDSRAGDIPPQTTGSVRAVHISSTGLDLRI